MVRSRIEPQMMRFASSSSSSFSLQLFAAATEATTMSSTRASSRGGRNPFRWSRGFCDRPNRGGRDAFVSGDSHLRSVRDANYSSRQGNGGNFGNSGGGGGYQRQPFYPPPHFHQPQPNTQQQQPFHPPPHLHQPGSNTNQRQPFYRPPPFRQPGPITHQRQTFYPPPPFRQQQPVRPQRKALDHRNWEYALSQPPSDCERFVVLSYNILADYLALKHRHELYFHIPRHILDWEWRREKIVWELGLWSPDIICLQEVDRFQDLEEPLKLRGYDGIWKMRTGLPVDGCAIFWRTTRFELRHEEYIEFNKLGLRDNVAQICVLKSKNQNPATDESTASLTSSSDANHVVICNIHVLYNPGRGEIKLGQARVLLDRAHAVSRMWNDAPVVVCGDFNCTPKSPLYNFISERKLDVTGLPRDQISGQRTAQISPRTYNQNPGHGLHRTQSLNNFVGTSMLVDEKDGNMKHNHTPDTQDHYKPYSDMENASSQEISSQPQSITGVLDMSQKSGSVGQCQDESKMIPMEETQQDSIEVPRDNFLLTHDIPVEPLRDSPSNYQEEGVAAVDLVNVVRQELTLEVTSSPEDTTAHPIQGSFNEQSQSNLCTSNIAIASVHNESVSDDRGKGSLDLKESTPSTEVAVNCTEARHNEKPVEAFISDIPSDGLVSEASTPEGVEVCLPKSLGEFSSNMAANVERADPSTSSDSTNHVNISDASCVNLNLDQKLVDFSPDKFVEVTEKGHVGHYRGGTFSSDTSGTDDVSPFNGDSDSTFIRPESAEADQSSDKYYITAHTSDLPPPGTEVPNYTSPSINSQPFTMERNAYDPSLWTPMEIETATGNAECTLIEHHLKLKSTYAEVEDYSETRDSSREPQVTSYNRRFMGTVDYIWCSEGLQTVKVLDTIPKRGMQWTPGFPTPKWGSDHIALASQLAFKKDVDHS